ncbi:hypothetical protein D1223_15410 [Henriciella mobilis]|uniref:Uncharacterized protein n=1 Tax=Henriciella mobilis TaxID=2305467 RepID=A0A399R9T9_9PROT|nr:hypothetical protein D1223_15410 [Henriciella mobilis]
MVVVPSVLGRPVPLAIMMASRREAQTKRRTWKIRRCWNRRLWLELLERFARLNPEILMEI